MRIGVDFDRVLFRTDEFNEYLKEETGLHHVEEDVYDEDGCYSPEKHAKACEVDVEDVYKAMKDLNRFLYGDVDKLRELKPEHELVVVTRGEEKFQRTKVRNSGVQRLFDQLLIVQGATKDVADIDFLVDDREKEIKEANVPGMIFDREKHDIDDLIERIRDLE
ncbi:MAG: hypothetical protein ABEJ36_03705 [Candidatus Nanosalina sp.]